MFYRKQDGSTFVFEKLAENLSITPLLFTEDYIISKLNFDDYTCLRPFLSEQDAYSGAYPFTFRQLIRV